jgi:uncharacterized protein DUF6152
MKIRLVVLVMGIWAAVPAVAHHSFAAEFDFKKPVDLSGTVTKVDWTNPHARIYMDVKDADGKLSNWECELGSPNTLMHKGWTRNSLKPGDQISVSGFLAKDADRVANAREVKLANGRKVFAGSEYSEGETK